jgi:hypothetical protein
MARAGRRYQPEAVGMGTSAGCDTVRVRQDWVRTGAFVALVWAMVVHLAVITFCANPVRYVSAVLLAVGSGAVATGLGLPAPWIALAVVSGFADSLVVRLERFL